MYHTTYDIQFVTISAYFVQTEKPCSYSVVRAVRFEDEHTPDWDDLWRVSDCVLFNLNVDIFRKIRKHVLVREEFWIPYIFIHEGQECEVRVFPSSNGA